MVTVAVVIVVIIYIYVLISCIQQAMLEQTRSADALLCSTYRSSRHAQQTHCSAASTSLAASLRSTHHSADIMLHIHASPKQTRYRSADAFVSRRIACKRRSWTRFTHACNPCTMSTHATHAHSHRQLARSARTQQHDHDIFMTS